MLGCLWAFSARNRSPAVFMPYVSPRNMPPKKVLVVAPDTRAIKGIERRFGLIVAGVFEGSGVSFRASGFGFVSMVETMEYDKKCGDSLGFRRQ